MKRILAIGFVFAVSMTAAPTYHKDVAPILQSRCQGCHRKGEIGPMTFNSYKEVRPWAKSIRESVLSKKMPPWFANPQYGHFSNDRSMSKQEIETLVSWVDAGSPEGDPKQAPSPRTWIDGWSIPTPDTVVEMPKAFSIPADGKIDYQYIVVPTGFTEDRWVQMVEARPTDRSVVHHIVIYLREPGSNWLRGEAEPGVPFVPPRKTPDGKDRNDIGGAGSEVLTIYTPGNTPDIWRPGLAKLVKAGTDLVFQMHYTASGKAAQDQSRVGFVFAKEAPAERVLTLALGNSKFVIPPGAPNHQVDAAVDLPNSGTLLSIFPHMHVRGKAFDFRVTQPGEQVAKILDVPKYDFNWQLTYRLEQPMLLKANAKVECSGWFDNSPNNKYNPDPKAEVRFGEQSWEEMMIGFFDVAVDARMDRKTFMKKQPAKADD